MLWLLAGINVAVGLQWSAATAARRVRVLGAPEFDKARIRRELEGLSRVPWLAVDARSIESALMQSSSAESAQLSRSPFGSATLRMSYRLPVARVVGTEGVFLSETGSLFRALGEHRGLPAVKVPREAFLPVLALAGAWPSAQVAAACKRTAGLPFAQTASIEVVSSGGVCLNTGQTARILLGSPDGLEHKFAKLRQLLEERPNLLSSVSELNLSVPDRPMAVPVRRNE